MTWRKKVCYTLRSGKFECVRQYELTPLISKEAGSHWVNTHGGVQNKTMVSVTLIA